MFCAVIGQKYIWLFNAPNKTEGRKRANTILFFEKIGVSDTISGFSIEEGYWQAVASKSDDVKDLVKKTDRSKIVEIKRRRNPTVDVLYVTRLQKERW